MTQTVSGTKSIGLPLHVIWRKRQVMPFQLHLALIGPQLKHFLLKFLHSGQENHGPNGNITEKKKKNYQKF